MTGRFDVTRSGHPRIAMLTRLPERGRVKTRLEPALGRRGAAALHRQLSRFVAEGVFALGATGEAEVEVWHDQGSARQMRAWLGELPRYRRQPAGDLGARLRAVFERAFAEGVGRCVAVGSDCPAMTAEHLRGAFTALGRPGVDVVLGPAVDGGYWLVGIAATAASRVLPHLFEGIHWSSCEVLRQTLERVAERGLGLVQLERLADVDRPEDLSEWARLRPGPAGRQRVSMIVPTLDEARRIEATVTRARGAGVDEVIVADGGSADATRELAARAGARVIEAPRGRARQMNAGAARATGELLLFLHADTTVPPGAAELIRRALAEQGVSAGAFAYRAAGAGRWDPVLTAGNRLRYGITRHPYGDQGLFLRARTFRALGGFPVLPVMEDWELVHRLHRLGRVVVLPEAATTSAASFADHGVLRGSLFNLVAIIGYQLGIDPHRLAVWRGRVARRAG